MIVNDIHESYSQPPTVPMITGMVSKPKKVSPLLVQLREVQFHLADVRMKNFQQLRYLQQLFQDDVLTEAEYTEQKSKILQALHTL